MNSLRNTVQLLQVNYEPMKMESPYATVMFNFPLLKRLSCVSNKPMEQNSEIVQFKWRYLKTDMQEIQ